MNINYLGRKALEINASNGWDVFTPADWPAEGETDKVRHLCTHMALVHSEVSEATEAVRKRDFGNFKEELADVVIRVASTASGLGIDLQDEILRKLTINASRGYRHGGKAV